MDYQRPDPDKGSSPNGARVEDDFVRPLSPMRSVSRHSLPAALPFALAGLLVVSSVVFGAAVVQNLAPPSTSASPIVVGDDNPTPTATLAATPTATPTETPGDAIPGILTLAVEALPGQAGLTWGAYTGADFAYYKVVRSTDGTATWPTGEGDTLVAAIDNVGTVTFTDDSGAGTFTYRVFAVKSAGAAYEILAMSVDVTATVGAAPTATPKPTPKPTPIATPKLTAPPVVALTLEATGTDNGSYYTVHLTWTKYTGPYFNYYGIQKSAPGTPSALPADPTLAVGATPWWYTENVNTTSNAGDLAPFTFKMGATEKTYKFKLWAYTEQSLAYSDGGVVPACYVGTFLGISNVVTVTIPAKVAPTPTPSPTPTPTPTPTPVH